MPFQNYLQHQAIYLASLSVKMVRETRSSAARLVAAAAVVAGPASGGPAVGVPAAGGGGTVPGPVPVPGPASVPAPVPAPALAPAPAPPLQHPKAPDANLSRHGRPLPYAPTPQPHAEVGKKKTKWEKVKGNPPPGIGRWQWDEAYNRADSNGYKDRRDLAKLVRENGMTRDVAIDELIRGGFLPAGFQDINP
ncbi:hypothetical protein VTL71DRAFT_11158 [Oculimacula yallundae]|uniref:Uncharacterized protein n=1 Tax=Oculimacula yallundae TaxID=86028 RepID=A0ABR4CW70_9HELO